MKPIILKIILGVLGAGTVGGTGYLIWRFLKKRKEAMKEMEALSVEEYIFNREEADAMLKEEIEKDPRSKAPVLRDDDDPNHDPTDISKEKFGDGLKRYMIDARAKENLEKYFAELENPEDDDEELDEEDDIHRGADGPYTITPGEFCNTRTYYDKISLNYFVDDDVVADDRDDILENAYRIVGDLKAAFNESPDRDLVYIRNEELEVDYEISRVDSSYRKEVLHLDER